MPHRGWPAAGHGGFVHVATDARTSHTPALLSESQTALASHAGVMRPTQPPQVKRNLGSYSFSSARVLHSPARARPVQRTHEVTPLAVELQRNPFGHVPLLHKISHILLGVQATANPGILVHESLPVQKRFVQMLRDVPHF